jgi:hypothetical protein
MDIFLNGQPHASTRASRSPNCSKRRATRNGASLSRSIAKSCRAVRGAHILRDGDRVEIVHAIGGG